MTTIVNRNTNTRVLGSAYANNPASMVFPEVENFSPAATNAATVLSPVTGIVQTIEAVNTEAANDAFKEIKKEPEAPEKKQETEASFEAVTHKKEPAPARESFSRKDKRLSDLAARRHEAERERDYYAKKNKELELQLLAKEKEATDQQLSSLSSLMLQAKESGNDEQFVEATKMMSQAQIASMQHASSLKTAQKEYNDYRNVEAEPEEDTAAVNIYRAISDRREIESDDYSEWLLQNPVYNPFNEDFNSSLAEDMIQIKKQYNNYLTVKKDQDTIGSRAYYSNLDRILEEKMLQKYAEFEEPKKTVKVKDPVYTPEPERGPALTNNMNNPGVAPVNRETYASPKDVVEGLHLEPLTPFEKRIAEISPMYKGAGTPQHKYGLPMTTEEKYRAYQLNKARQKAGGNG